MKCEEVVEWMHRYLDHDLGEAETAQLLQHMDECPECAENFSMLRALSKELEDLPQVSPGFSLVDAIMPQLEAIDKARKEQSSTIQEMSPVPAAFEHLQHSSSSEQKAKAKWFNSMVGRMSMGAAAAAVVLGFAIWGYQPEQIENADSMMIRSAAPQENKDEEQPAESMEVNNDQPDSSPQKDENVSTPDASNDPVIEPSTQSKGDQPEESNSTETQQPDKAGNQAPAEPSTTGQSSPEKGKQGGGAPSDSNNVQKSTDSNPGTEQKNQANEGNGVSSNEQQEDIAPDPNERVDETFTPQMIIPDQTDPFQENESNELGTGQDKDATGNHQGFVAPEQGVTSQVTAKEWKSPNGAYIVMLTGDQLSIYGKSASDPDALTLIEQRNVEGTVKSASWSKDSMQFSYETDKDGTTTKNSFKVDGGTNGASAK